MKYLLIIFFVFYSMRLLGKDYTMEDTATFETIANIKLSDNTEFSVVSIIGHWKDNLGSFGSNKCYGTLEKKEKITLYLDVLCEKESEKGKIITRGGREKSLQEAGVGYIKIIDATKDYKSLLNTSCKYAVSYFENNLQFITKCNVDKSILNKIKNNL
ncbi:MAG: hypothetical protein CMJ13_01180 [Pelagibacterales bacterium]|nr:hypothetical protein [Pelagibacterales bacterium]